MALTFCITVAILQMSLTESQREFSYSDSPSCGFPQPAVFKTTAEYFVIHLLPLASHRVIVPAIESKHPDSVSHLLCH